MASAKDEHAGKELPPAPLVIPKGNVTHRAEEAKQCKLMARPDVGRNGRRIQLLANHFGVKFLGQDAVFYHYSVAIKSEDQRAVEGKGIGRKVINKLYQTYSSELAGKELAYDGGKSLFTVGALPRNIFDFTVILEESSARSSQPGNGSPGEGDRKRSKRLLPAKTFNVEISYAAKIPFRSIAQAIKGIEAENTQEALRVLDIILRQQQAKRGYLLVRQSFFNVSDSRNFCNLGGGVTGCRGFDSSFRITDGGLSLNMDVSTTMLVTPGPVLDFLLANQTVGVYQQIDWGKAKRMLRSLRIKARHRNMEYKIIGLSELPCNQQRFAMKVRNGNGDGRTEEVTVYEYFAQQGIQLQWSAHVPCLDVGKPKRPTYLPVELCDLIPLQRYTKSLSNQQRASLVEKSRQKPPERIRVVTEAVRNNKYDEDPMLVACGISIDKQLTRIDGRVLDAPKLQFGGEESIIPRNGRWNFNSKKLLQPKHIERWAIVNFSARCDLSYLSRELINCGIKKGIQISRPHTLIDEERQWRSAGPTTRVEKMFELIRAKLPGPPEFLLCVLPERKNCDIYGPWKKKNLHELGIVTQCIAPLKINDQYLTNVLLKINAKLGGMNSLLTVEWTPSIPFVNRVPTMIVGMDVSHGSPGRSDIPSIAAVVGSRSWPQVSRYRASVRSQSPKVEMIDALFKIMPNGEDEGMMRELFLDFYQSSNSQKPEQVIIFRDGVSESQFKQVLSIELDQIIKAINHLGVDHLPKFTVIVAQKNHHTKLFQDGAPDNVPPGTVVDTKIAHPRNYDFFMCAHAGLMGTTRPTHYHVLLDEIGFPADDLQQFVHSLSYVYQRSTTAISVVAPICYAHLAAQQMSQFVKFEECSDTSSGQVTAAGGPAVPELPKLHENVRSSMFFC